MALYTDYVWEEFDNQQDVLDRTQGVGIQAILVAGELIQGDVGWLMLDGRRVEYHKSSGGGCPTCGWGSDDHSWYLATPKVEGRR